MNKEKITIQSELIKSLDQYQPSIEELLYPNLPDEYFKDKDDMFNDKNIIEQTIETYQNLKIKPHINIKSLGGDGNQLDDAAKKTGLEIGLNFNF